jgi:Protein of unknwon function (DUF3310)
MEMDKGMREDHLDLVGKIGPAKQEQVPQYGALPVLGRPVLNRQVGGDHYTKLKIQPIEYVMANGIQFPEGNVIKYVTRWRDKGGIKDLEKARHMIDLLIEHEKSSGLPSK